jgi:hypothetical protein
MNNDSQAADANVQGGVSSTHRSTDAGEGPSLPPGANPQATFDTAEPQAWGQMWRQFVGAQTMSTFARAWLALQCERTDDVLAGLVLIGPADTGPYAPVAVWPEVQRDMDHLRAAAEQALTERRGVIERSTEFVPGGSLTFHVAYPLEVSTHLHGVVVIEATARPEHELQAVLRELHWGIGWVEARLRADAEHDIAQGSENLSMLLALVAEVIEESRFQSACAVLVTELAERLGCDRVSIGFSKRQQARVQAISHSATLDLLGFSGHLI